MSNLALAALAIAAGIGMSVLFGLAGVLCIAAYDWVRDVVRERRAK